MFYVYAYSDPDTNIVFYNSIKEASERTKLSCYLIRKNGEFNDL